MTGRRGCGTRFTSCFLFGWGWIRANMPDDARMAVMGHTGMQPAMRYTHRDAASLGRLMAAAIPDLHDGIEIIDATPARG